MTATAYGTGGYGGGGYGGAPTPPPGSGSWTNDLYLGISQFVNAAGAVTYLPSQQYRDANRNLLPGVSEPVLWWGRTVDGPDRGVALMIYATVDDPVLADVEVRAQFRIRGTADIRTVSLISDGLFTALHGLAQVSLGGVAVAAVQRVSSVPLGVDETGRWQQTDNYSFRCTHPSVYRTN